MKEDVFLALAFIAVIIFGYFQMVKLDAFLENNRKHIEDKKEVQEPLYIMLSDNLSDDEIIKEIKCFREKNENVRVVLYNSNSENSEKIFIEEDVADL